MGYGFEPAFVAVPANHSRCLGVPSCYGVRHWGACSSSINVCGLGLFRGVMAVIWYYFSNPDTLFIFGAISQDGQPPLGWSDTAAYLVLPLLLIISQYISVQIMQSSQPNDPNQKSSQVLTSVLPLMIGYFALSVPSGLSLYWFTNNILSTLQQVFLQKMGGANNPLGQLSDDFFKEEQSQPLKSISNDVLKQQPLPSTTVSETKAKQAEEKSPSTGLQPGERFKKLKEEEAKRKRQKEEEKMKSIAAAENNNAATISGSLNGSAKEHQDTLEIKSENGNPINGTSDTNVSEDLEDISQEAVKAHRSQTLDQSSGEDTS